VGSRLAALSQEPPPRPAPQLCGLDFRSFVHELVVDVANLPVSRVATMPLGFACVAVPSPSRDSVDAGWPRLSGTTRLSFSICRSHYVGSAGLCIDSWWSSHISRGHSSTLITSSTRTSANNILASRTTSSARSRSVKDSFFLYSNGRADHALRWTAWALEQGEQREQLLPQLLARESRP